MKSLSLALLLAALPIAACSQTQEPAQVASTATASAEQAASAIWIDVRTEEEFASGHLPDAHLIPHQNIVEGIEKLNLPKDADIRLYCQSGRRAGIALEELKKLGYTNVSNQGGYADLKAQFQK